MSKKETSLIAVLMTIVVLLVSGCMGPFKHPTPNDEEFKKIWNFKDEDLQIKEPKEYGRTYYS